MLTLWVSSNCGRQMSDKIYVVPNLVDGPARGCLYTSYVPPGRDQYNWVTSPSVNHKSGRWRVPIYAPSGVRSLVPEIAIEPIARFHSSNDFQLGCWSGNSLVLTPSVLVIMVGFIISLLQDTIVTITKTKLLSW
jgi:hypothetical protein